MTLNTALIVDDSKLARVTLRKKIQAHGLTVELAESAGEAYKVLPGISPDIIFMDHLMPDVSGFEATRHIRQMPGFDKIPIVMCSGKEHEGYLEEALAIGANQVLSKPPVDEELDAVLMTLSTAEIAEVNTDQEPAVVEPENSEQQVEMSEESAVEILATEVAIEAVDIEKLCKSIIEEQKAGLLAELQDSVANTMAQDISKAVSREVQQIESPALQEAPALDSAEIEALCRSVIAEEKPGIVLDVQASIPDPVMPEINIPEIDMTLVNKAIAEMLDTRLSDVIEGVKIELTEKLNAQIPEEISRQADSSMDQDIQGILDLRINVMLADKFSEVDQKFESMEANLGEQMSVLKASSEVMAIDSDLVLEGAGAGKGISQEFTASKGIESQLDQMIERQTQLSKTQSLLKKVTIAAFILSTGAALGVATFYLL